MIPASPAIGRRLTLAGLGIAAGILLAHFASLAHAWLVLAHYPFGVDYGEGIVWQQMRDMMRGTGYRPLGTYPAIVYHYPPVYHLVVGGIVRLLGTDGLATGRTVSFAASLVAAGLVGALTADAVGKAAGRVVRAMAGTLAALVFLSCRPVVDWVPLMRVDLLACTFSLAGLALAIRAAERPPLVHGAALCFVLAVYTKQTSIAAPLAALAAFACVRPRLAWICAGEMAVAGTIALAGLEWLTHGEFLRHVLLYNVNRVRPEMIGALLPPLREHGVYLVIAGIGATLLVGRQRALRCWPKRDAAARIGVLLYAAIKTLMLVLIVKSGANLNYMIEWFCAVAICIGVALSPTLAIAARDGAAATGRASPVMMLLPLALALQAAVLPRWSLAIQDADRQAARLAPLVAMIRASTRPVVSDEMTLPIRAGRDVQWEPAIAAELASMGRYDQPGFVRLIRAHRFGFFVTEGRPGQQTFDDRYNPPVAAAIASAYGVERRIGGLTLWLDRPPPVALP